MLYCCRVCGATGACSRSERNPPPFYNCHVCSGQRTMLPVSGYPEARRIRRALKPRIRHAGGRWWQCSCDEILAYGLGIQAAYTTWRLLRATQ